MGHLPNVQFIAAGEMVYVKAGREYKAWAREVFELRDGLWQPLGEKAARSIAVGGDGRVYLNDGNYHVF